jgi:hypothetical protein
LLLLYFKDAIDMLARGFELKRYIQVALGVTPEILQSIFLSSPVLILKIENVIPAYRVVTC